MGAAPQRPLGVIEALTAVTQQCPHAAVREHANRALAAVEAGGAGALREQASLVLSTLSGWRGARADQVKQALRDFVATAPGSADASGSADPTRSRRPDPTRSGQEDPSGW